MRFGFRELVFFIVLLAVPVAAWMFLFKPRNDDIQKAQQEISVKQANLQKLADVTSRISDIGLEIEKGREKIAVIEQQLPTAQDVEGILEQVWSIAKKNRLIVKSIKSEKAVPTSLYMEQPLKVQMEGDWDGFYQFLLELERLPRITRIFAMDLERLGGKDNPKAKSDEPVPPGYMKAEFTLSIYFQGGKPAAAAS